MKICITRNLDIGYEAGAQSAHVRLVVRLQRGEGANELGLNSRRLGGSRFGL